jgi:hypothetical protein
MGAQPTYEEPLQQVEDLLGREDLQADPRQLDRPAPDEEIVGWVTNAYCFKRASDGADRVAAVV